MVNFEPFQVSATEITVGQYRTCVDSNHCSTPSTQCTGMNSNWSKTNDALPINCISWKEAQRFAQWVGGDLPSEKEWEYISSSKEKSFDTPNTYGVYHLHDSLWELVKEIKPSSKINSHTYFMKKYLTRAGHLSTNEVLRQHLYQSGTEEPLRLSVGFRVRRDLP